MVEPVRQLRVHVVDCLDELLTLQSEWLALEQAAQVDLPFQTWEWTVSWWTHLREQRTGIQDHLRVYLLRDETGVLVGIAPMVLTERPTVGPLRVRYLHFLGADPNITEISTLLCVPDLHDECWRALRTHVSHASDEWDWVAWEEIAADSTPEQIASKAATKSAMVLKLPSDWDTLKGQLGRNLKESLRKCYNSLRRDDLTFELETVVERDEVGSALIHFFELHASRAGHAEGPKHADVFASERSRAFLSDVSYRLSQRGVTRIYRLHIDGKVVATRIGFQLSETLYLYNSGWDGQYARYSVMTTLLAEVIKQAIANGSRTVHLSTGVDVSKTRWRPTEIQFATSVELAPRLSSFARFHAYHAARAVGTRVPDELLPGWVMRRPPTDASSEHVRQIWRLLSNPWLRLHALAPAAVAPVLLDQLDGRLDHVFSMLPRMTGLL